VLEYINAKLLGLYIVFRKKKDRMDFAIHAYAPES